MLRSLLAMILSSALAHLASAQSDDLKIDAVKDFKTFYRQNKEVSQRVEAIITLKENECVPAAMALLPLLADKHPDIRSASMQVISTYKEIETFQAWIDELPEVRDNARRALIIEVLGRAGIQQCLPLLTQIGITKGIDANVKIAISTAVARLLDGQSNNGVLTRFLADSDPSVRISAANTVSKLKIRAIGDHLVPLLSDKYWQVQSAAISAVGQVRVAKAIDPLIAMMREQGRFRTDTAEALFLITMKDFGVYPDQWAKSIRELRSFGWQIPTDAEIAKAKAARQKNDAYYGKKASGRKKFGGIVTTSTRVLFIIDVSGSMEDHVVEKEKFDAGYDDYQKLTIVKTELINTIESLDKNTFFNIVAFATNLKPWKRGLVRASVTTKSAARSFIKRLRPIGGSEAAEMATAGLSSNLSAGRTNTFKALMYPFNIDPDKMVTQAYTGSASKKLIKNKLDTVFFLSDGQPSVGKFTDAEVILEEVRKVNEVYQMTIHAITIGQFQKDFLRTLASQNGGEYVDLGN